MGEVTLVVDHLKFRYEGLFNAAEIFNVISSFFFEKGYDWFEDMNEELITPEGKQLRMVLAPSKSTSDFYKIKAKIKVIMTNVKDVEVEHDGKTLRLNQGVVKMIIDGFVQSDRSGAWTKSPFYWFLTILGQKYFFKNHFQKMETWIISDLDDMHQQLKTYMNTFKYTYQT